MVSYINILKCNLFKSLVAIITLKPLSANCLHACNPIPRLPPVKEYHEYYEYMTTTSTTSTTSTTDKISTTITGLPQAQEYHEYRSTTYTGVP